MPFELIQETYFLQELKSIQDQENRLLEITAEYEEQLDNLAEDDKEAETVNEAQDGFVNAEVIKEAKRIRADIKKKTLVEKDSLEAIVLKVDELITEEKALKTKIKTETLTLHNNTKTFIENLTDAQVLYVLELKWISPVVTSLNSLPTTIISQLTNKVQVLANKYQTTYADVAKEINQAEKTLATLMDDLQGNTFDMQGLNELKTLLHGK
jgi:type I restriction enzyme M protein